MNVDTDGNRMVWDETLRQWVTVTGALSPAELAESAAFTSRFTPSRFDVRDYGAKLDGSTDDSVAFAAAIAAMRAAGRGAVFVPAGTMKLTSTVLFPVDTRVEWDDVWVESTVANAPTLWITGSNVLMEGRVTVDCNSSTASTGLRVQGTTDFSGSGAATHCNLSALDITVIASTERGFDISSNPAVGNTILNHFGNMRSYQGTGVGLELRTTSGTAGWTNANHFEWVSVQSHTSGTPVRVDYADGNHFDWLEVENCTGSGIYAIDLVNCSGFYVDSGWVEGNTGNLRIANNPAVLAVYISAAVDSLLIASDPKFSHTLSTNRSVVIRNKQDAREYGHSRMSRLSVGVDGSAANDQSVRPLAVSGGMECYRYSAGTGFYFKGQVAGMAFYMDDSTTTMLDINATRAVLSGNIVTGASSYVKPGRVATGSRPSASSSGQGAMIYDTTLSKPIWSDGTVWRDAAGTAV